MRTNDTGRNNNAAKTDGELPTNQRGTHVAHLSELTIGDRVLIGDRVKPLRVVATGTRTVGVEGGDELETPLVKLQGDWVNAREIVLRHRITRQPPGCDIPESIAELVVPGQDPSQTFLELETIIDADSSRPVAVRKVAETAAGTGGDADPHVDGERGVIMTDGGRDRSPEGHEEGHARRDGRDVDQDGGDDTDLKTDLSVLNAQRTAALAICAGEQSTVQAIQTELRDLYGELISYSRVYNHASTLVEAGLLRKNTDTSPIEFGATPTGRATIDTLSEWIDTHRPFEITDPVLTSATEKLTGNRSIEDVIEVVEAQETVLDVHKRLSSQSISQTRRILDDLGLLTPGGRLLDEEELAEELAQLRGRVQPSVDRGEGVVADGGQTIEPGGVPNTDMATPGEMAFVVEAMELNDVSVSSEEDRYIVSVRGPDRGVLDAKSVIELANQFGHQVKDVYADVEQPALTIEVAR